MAMTATQLEEIAAWCELTVDLTEERRHAQRQFFDEDDPRPVQYWPGAGDERSRLRRFLGWFMFDHELSGGEPAAARAARALYRGPAQEEVLRAVSGTRFVLAIVASVLPGRGVLLELEDERFEIRDRMWSRSFTPQAAVVAHLVPTGRPGQWLAAPGWGEWPIRFGPHMREELRKFQTDPLDVERLLQSRELPENEGLPLPPQDTTFAQAVARMTAAARAAGLTRLVMSAARWEVLVAKHMRGPDFNSFTEKVMERVGDVKSVEDLDRWLQMALNIWNNAPQPDRGGKSANELLRLPRI
jgi:hypothetical protein